MKIILILLEFKFQSREKISRLKLFPVVDPGMVDGQAYHFLEFQWTTLHRAEIEDHHVPLMKDLWRVGLGAVAQTAPASSIFSVLVPPSFIYSIWTNHEHISIVISKSNPLNLQNARPRLKKCSCGQSKVFESFTASWYDFL